MIGIVSTLMIILSAFQYEVIHETDSNSYNDYNNEQISANVTTIDKKVLDALSKFDRNVNI